MYPVWIVTDNDRSHDMGTRRPYDRPQQARDLYRAVRAPDEGVAIRGTVSVCSML